MQRPSGKYLFAVADAVCKEKLSTPSLAFVRELINHGTSPTGRKQDSLHRQGRFILRAKRKGQRMVAKRKFEGALATPIEPRNFRPGLICPDDEREAQVKQKKLDAAIEDFQKLIDLCHHYEIKSGDYVFMQLAVALAREFVPGFRVKAKRGRKKKWTVIPIAALIISMEREIRPDTAHGATWAATQLAKKEPWKSFLEAKDTGETDPNPLESLRKKYHEHAGSAIAEMARESFDLKVKDGQAPDFNVDLRDAVNKFLGS